MFMYDHIPILGGELEVEINTTNQVVNIYAHSTNIRGISSSLHIAQYTKDPIEFKLFNVDKLWDEHELSSMELGLYVATKCIPILMNNGVLYEESKTPSKEHKRTSS